MNLTRSLGYSTAIHFPTGETAEGFSEELMAEFRAGEELNVRARKGNLRGVVRRIQHEFIFVGSEDSGDGRERIMLMKTHVYLDPI